MKTLVLTFSLALLGLATSSKDLTEEEVDYKADFIVKVADYVTWPDGAASNTNGEIVVAVLGESPITTKLQTLAAAKTAEGRKMKVTTVTADDDLSACQILFVTTEDKTELAGILKKLNEAPVLTISDAYYFARYGVMVNFFKEEADGKEKIKFEVNTITMGFAGLKMSSKLLKLATVI